VLFAIRWKVGELLGWDKADTGGVLRLGWVTAPAAASWPCS